MKQKIELIEGNYSEDLDRLYEEKGEFVDLIFCDPLTFSQAVLLYE